MAERLLELISGAVTQVELDEIFEPINPHRPHRFARLPEIEEWLSDDALVGGYTHRERKIRFDAEHNIYFTNEDEISRKYDGFHVTVVGYRHRFSFTDPNTAFAFKLQFGGNKLTMNSRLV